MTCPYLEYQDAGSFDEPRAFCTVVDEFVQPMRADICNDRYALHHAEHCEIYREHERDGESVRESENVRESDDGDVDAEAGREGERSR